MSVTMDALAYNLQESPKIGDVQSMREETLYDLAEFFKVFGDTTRIKIISVLLNSSLCVGEISALLHISQSAISHQLRILRQARLVKYKKEGKEVFYSLDDEHIGMIFAIGLEHVLEFQQGSEHVL